MDTLTALSDAWVGLGGVVFGSLLTTLGVWLTNIANRRQLELQFRNEDSLFRKRQTKERLEELYILLCKWQHALFANYMNLTLVMKGQTDYNQYHDWVIENGPKQGVDFDRVAMIIGIYGGDLIPHYEKVLEARSAVNEIATQHKRAYKRGENDDNFLEPFQKAELALDKMCEDLKRAVAIAARNA